MKKAIALIFAAAVSFSHAVTISVTGTSVFLSDGVSLVPQGSYISVGYFDGAFTGFAGLSDRSWSDVIAADYTEAVSGAINPDGALAGGGTVTGIAGETLYMWVFNVIGAPTGNINAQDYGLFTGSSAVWTAKGDVPFPPEFSNINIADVDNSILGQNGGGNLTLASAVPEPSSFALLAGCFGLAWVMVRRRS
jgi:hypothetical protein